MPKGRCSPEHSDIKGKRNMYCSLIKIVTLSRLLPDIIVKLWPRSLGLIPGSPCGFVLGAVATSKNTNQSFKRSDQSKLKLHKVILTLKLIGTCRFQNWMTTVTNNSSKQTTHIQSKKTQVYFNSVSCTYMSATCFGLYLGHPQAHQYNNHTKEYTIRISGAPIRVLQSLFLYE